MQWALTRASSTADLAARDPPKSKPKPEKSMSKSDAFSASILEEFKVLEKVLVNFFDQKCIQKAKN